MDVDDSILFEPLDVGAVRLRNRIIVPPMVSNRSIASDDGVKWYRRFAAGGAGLVIVEATSVGRFGDELTAEGLRPLVDAVHAEGAAIAIQLFPITFGAGTAPGDLTVDQIREIVDQYAAAAAICRDAGFDGAEPHGAHGFLLNQFLSAAANQRDDAYGGSLENRMRLGLEIVRAVRSAAGRPFLVLYRHTPQQDGGYTIEDSLAFARELVAAGIDMLDISPASHEAPADRAAPFKEALDVPVIGVGEMDADGRGVEALREGRCDLIAIGRALIADSHWPAKIRNGDEDEIVTCVRCNEACFGGLREGKLVACTQWARE